MAKNKENKPKKRNHRKWVVFLWMAVFIPILLMATTFLAIAQGWLWELPSFEELENPKSNLATEIYSSDLKVIGKYFSENRTQVRYHEISPYVVTALVATEDERYHSHSGIDLRSITRAVARMGKGGGGSTITQQLAKMLFHKPATTTLGRIKQKLMEWVIAVRLERQYTKDEIVTMYLNRFDFVNQAVGIKSAARVYFDKEPQDLDIAESALLVGMAKNPSLFNPKRFPDTATHRRNVVFYQMKRNDLINQAEFDSLKALPLNLKFQRVDHKEGLAPYYREALRSDLARIFREKDEDGNYVISKDPDGKEPYNIYRDGLKIYSTVDSRMQEYAEWAVAKHLGGELQEDFWKDLSKKKNAPFDWRWSKEQVERTMQTARKRSGRYLVMAGDQCGNCGRRAHTENGERVPYVNLEDRDGHKMLVCSASDCGFERAYVEKDSIFRSFDTPVPMRIFSWNGLIDTVMTPNDSIRWYKSFLRAGMLSMDPKSGQIKAWVGGINSRYFAYDHVRSAKRQVGSTFKPFVYAQALDAGIGPCTEIPNIEYTIHKGEYNLLKDWTPRNTGFNFDGNVSLKYALANSMNNITAYLLKMGYTNPDRLIKFVRKMGIESPMDTVPSLCLGVADLKLYEVVSANCTFVNKGNWVEPYHIIRIEDKNGNTIYPVASTRKRKFENVMSEEKAYKVVRMMKGTVQGVNHDLDKYNYPIGTAIRLKSGREYGGITYPCAGKTGTTQNHSDGWYMGLTPDLVTGVWVGGEDRTIRFATLSKGMGTNMALPIWGYYMKKVWADDELDITKKDFEAPEGIDPNLFDCESGEQFNEYDDYDPEDPWGS